jgi:hypothetical protein
MPIPVSIVWNSGCFPGSQTARADKTMSLQLQFEIRKYGILLIFEHIE